MKKQLAALALAALEAPVHPNFPHVVGGRAAQLHAVLLGDENIGRFEIAVDDSLLVGVLHGVA